MNIYQILNVPPNTDRKIIQDKYVRLIDSYSVIVDFSNNDNVAKLANLKLEKLREAGRVLNLSEFEIIDQKLLDDQEEIGKIKLILNSSNRDKVVLQGDKILRRINQLGESGEKHYLLAIINLQINRTLNGFNTVISELNNALQYDPENIAYQSLLKSLATELEAYQAYQQEKVREQEIIRKRLEEQSRLELQRTQIKNATKTGASACCSCCCWILDGC